MPGRSAPRMAVASRADPPISYHRPQDYVFSGFNPLPPSLSLSGLVRPDRWRGRSRAARAAAQRRGWQVSLLVSAGIGIMAGWGIRRFAAALPAVCVAGIPQIMTREVWPLTAPGEPVAARRGR